MRTFIAGSLALASMLCLAACEAPAPAPNAAPPGSAPVASATLPTAASAVTVATAEPAAPPKNPALAAPADVAAPPADAQKTASGLASKVLTAGTGTKHPKPEDKVTVHYSGWTKEGVLFDSSVERGESISFPLNGVIPGWTEGVQLMVEGEKRRFWIPAELAYGEKPRQPGAPAGQLTFDVELISIKEAPPPPETPKDVAKAPADAKKTKSGLAYKVISPGKGTESPTADDTVVVHYSGWTKDGKMFDSSIARDEPARFPLKGVIPGWTEGVQLMKQGDKVRFWIPADLAYGDPPKRPGAPAGQLTFDIELLEIQKRR
jgi:FKBP-type peptidyl-prolyl cis-trans isomerase